MLEAMLLTNRNAMVVLPLVALPAGYVLAAGYEQEFGTSIASAAVGRTVFDRIFDAIGSGDRHWREEQR